MKRAHKKKEKKEKPEAYSPPEDLKELSHDELSGVESRGTDLAASSVDEDEDEGLGDGNIGHSNDDILRRE
jgi:hypothetical protein